MKKYRNHEIIDEAGEATQGIYATLFEECYEEFMAMEKYALLKDYFNSDVKKAHNAYFSKDKKGVPKNTRSDTQADDVKS